MKTLCLKISVLAVTLSFIVISSQAQAVCASTWDTNIDPQLEEVIRDFNPFWGTWSGSYDGGQVVAEFYLDSKNQFNVRGQFKGRTMDAVKTKICYRNGLMQARVFGFTADIEILSQRQIRIRHFFLKHPIVMTR